MNFLRLLFKDYLYFLFLSATFFFRPITYANTNSSDKNPLFFNIPRIPVQNSSDYHSLLVDKHNRLFISTDNQVFMYDGFNYQPLLVPGRPVLCKNTEGLIALGGRNYLSLLTPTINGNYSVKEIISSKNSLLVGEILSIGFDNQDIIFSTGEMLWRYDGITTAVVDSSLTPLTVYSGSSNSVIISKGREVYTLTNRLYHKVITNCFRNDIQSIFQRNDTLYIATKTFPWLFYCHNNNIIPVSIPFLPSDEIVRCALISSSGIILLTNSSGVIFIDEINENCRHFNNLIPFSSNIISDIQTSDNINFFAISPTQIWRFVNPAFSGITDYRNELPGEIKMVLKSDKKMFIASSLGLYFYNLGKPSFTIQRISSGCYNDLIIYNGNVWGIGPRAICRIQSTSTAPHKILLSEDHLLVKSFPPKLVSSGPSGIVISELENPDLKRLITNPNNDPIKDIFTADSFLIIRTQRNTWYYANLNLNTIQFEELKSVTPTEISSVTILESIKKNFTIHKNVCYAISEGINEGENRFELTYPVGYTFSGEKIYLSFSDFNPNYQLLFIKSFRSGRDPSTPIILSSLESIYKVNAVYLDDDSSLYISTAQGLITFSSKFITYKISSSFPHLCLFSLKEIKKKGEIEFLYRFLSRSGNDSFDYQIDNNSEVEFLVSGTDPLNWNHLIYSKKLEGHDNAWSEWSTNNQFNFSKLKPGGYKFIVKAKNSIGNISPEKTIRFIVTPPFFQTKAAYGLTFILLLLIAYSFIRWRNYYHALDKRHLEMIINRRTEELVKEKEKTENLLARVLPRETANELKETGKVNTQRFNVVTVLFSDIQGFTRITDETNPEILIDQLDKFFLYFDSVVEKYKIEKIKTIGDAYMCAGGIPKKNRTNPVEVVLAAFEMMHFMKDLNRQHHFDFDLWDLRIGIDTGPVIAGVVGRKKLSYDIWGSTVNTASRMESSGEIGKINISGNTYLLVKEYFDCTYRGKMPVKNKGDIEMYFVDGIKPMLSENSLGLKPNKEFEVQLQLLRLGDLEEFILDKLDKGLPKNLYYHNLKHTVDVYTQVELIGRSENVTKEELLLLRTAALFHDLGHLIDYSTHEEMGVKLAREIIPDYQYSERQIEIISNLIMITKLPPKPHNLLEAIMCDADLDYLGRTDFIPVSNMLYKELHEHGMIGTIHEWNEMQMSFIEKHQYFTNTARRLRNVNKKSQLENIRRWIEKNKL